MTGLTAPASQHQILALYLVPYNGIMPFASLVSFMQHTPYKEYCYLSQTSQSNGKKRRKKPAEFRMVWVFT